MYTYEIKLDRVIDGDTIDAYIDLGFDVSVKKRIRFMGINTPESRTRDLDEKARGKLAGKYLKDAIDAGNQVVIQTKLKDSKGKFGRVLGDVVVDGKNINQSMINDHMAVAYHGQSKDDIELQHLANREILIEAGLHTPVD